MIVRVSKVKTIKVKQENSKLTWRKATLHSNFKKRMKLLLPYVIEYLKRKFFKKIVQK
jgi:hypothetical protein